MEVVMQGLFALKNGFTILSIVVLGITSARAESVGRPDIYPDEDLSQRVVARQLSPAEMRAGIEAALKIPEWKPGDSGKAANPWVPVGKTITSVDPTLEHAVVGRIRGAAWAWSNGLSEETLWAGTSSGGLYMLGRNPLNPWIRWWVPVSESLPGSPSIGAFLVNPGNSNIILIGTGDPGREGGSGLYRTINGGTTWTRVAMTPEPAQYYKFVLAPGDSSNQMVFAATSLGLYVSFDFGIIWTRLGVFSGIAVTDITKATADSDWIVGVSGIGVSHCSQLVIGSICSDATGFAGTVKRVSVAVSPANTSLVFALVEGAGGGYNGTYRSADGGASFVNIDDHFSGGGDPIGWGQGYHANAIAIDPANPDRLMVGMAAAQMTQNATAANPNDVCWRRNKGVAPVSTCDTTGLDAGHVDQTSMTFVPQSIEPGNTKILVSNDGGIYVYDWATNGLDDYFNEVGINASQVTLPTTMDISRSNPNRLLAGLQDNGVMRVNLDGNPGAYQGLTSADGAQVSIHPNNDGDYAFVLGMAFNRYLWIGDGPRENMNVDLPGNGPFSMSMTYNHDNSLPVIFTHDGRYIFWRWVWEYETVDWKYANPSHPLPAGIEIESVEVGNFDPLAIYITDKNSQANGTAALYIMTGSPGAMTWVDGTPGGSMVPDEPAGGKVFADRSGTNGDHVYFATGSHRPSRVFLSTNQGASWWDVTGDLKTLLPNVDYWQLLSHPYDHSQLFLATEVGIFRSDSGGRHWYRYMDNMPDVVKVRAMQIHSNGPDDTTLVIGTWGNGLWKRQVDFQDLIFINGFEVNGTGFWDDTVGGS